MTFVSVKTKTLHANYFSSYLCNIYTPMNIRTFDKIYLTILVPLVETSDMLLWLTWILWRSFRLLDFKVILDGSFFFFVLLKIF